MTDSNFNISVILFDLAWNKLNTLPGSVPDMTAANNKLRIMLGIGFLLFFVALWGYWLRRKKKLLTSKTFLRTATLCAPLGFVATFAGWITTETGRQPWVVYNLLRTASFLLYESQLQLA